MTRNFELIHAGHIVGDLAANSAEQAMERAHELGIPCDRAIRITGEGRKQKTVPGFIRAYMGGLLAVILFVFVALFFSGCSGTQVTILSASEYPIAVADGEPKTSYYVIRYIRGDEIHQMETGSEEEYRTILAYLEGRK